MKLKVLSVFLFLSLPCVTLTAQDPHHGDTIICFGNDFEFEAFVDPPDHFLAGEGALSQFEITYEEVPAEAQAAIDYAASIWAATLASEVPIRVEVTWDSLEENSLAAAGPTTLFRGFPGVESPELWYPVALAEAITGEELNELISADITVRVNSEAEWYFGTDGNTPRRLFDLVSVILHELARIIHPPAGPTQPCPWKNRSLRVK